MNIMFFTKKIKFQKKTGAISKREGDMFIDAKLNKNFIVLLPELAAVRQALDCFVARSLQRREMQA